MNLLSISYGRALFNSEDPERKRMEMCAQSMKSFHMVIFTLRSDKYQVTRSAGLVLHPTNSRTKIHMVFDAISIGRQIIRNAKGSWVVTAQDPFEAGVVGYVISKLSKKPFNVQEHGDFFSTPYWRQDALLNRVRFVLGKFILRSADTVRVVSERIKNSMQALHVPSDRILYLPVRTDAIDRPLESKTDLHTQYPDASTIVLSIGRLVAQKNIPLLIRSFAKLCQVDPKALLLIGGKGNKLEELKQQVKTLDLEENILFLPWTDDPYALIRSADIIALSSDWEGWGRVLIEAMAAGTPVVTTDVGCAGEVLLDNTHGLVVGVRDEAAFTDKLILLAGNPALRKEFGTQAQHDVQQVHITPEEYVKQWAAVWDHTYKSAQ